MSTYYLMVPPEDMKELRARAGRVEELEHEIDYLRELNGALERDHARAVAEADGIIEGRTDFLTQRIKHLTADNDALYTQLQDARATDNQDLLEELEEYKAAVNSLVRLKKDARAALNLKPQDSLVEAIQAAVSMNKGQAWIITRCRRILGVPEGGSLLSLLQKAMAVMDGGDAAELQDRLDSHRKQLDRIRGGLKHACRVQGLQLSEDPPSVFNMLELLARPSSVWALRHKINGQQEKISELKALLASSERDRIALVGKLDRILEGWQ